MFQQHNSSNFISVMRPVLKSFFPMKYFGKDGAQNLQRDLRYLKISCDGKIPEDQSKDNINCLLGQGKSRVSDSVGTFKSSCDNKLADNDTSSELKDKCHDVVSIASITAKTSPNVTSDAMAPFVRSPVCQPIPYSVTSPLNMTGYMPVADPYYNMPYTWMYGNYHNSVVYQPMPNVPTSRASTPTSTVTSGSPPLPPGSPPRNPPLPDKEQEF
ncbi:hypothetical protein FSP39_004952 [Pinctada imbricata]|uniref:Uncharacterized protein n=1 Tax=Pinctada imbricata TaxID=66713 RepID=A0AA89BNM9_PINIB|nr:hypothetical protein FSP39_004952 [Pinctada imbricata]